MPCRPGIATLSLGSASTHALELKLAEAAQAGFGGVEVFSDDLEHLARSHGEDERQGLLRAARDVAAWCAELGLAIVCLQPFRMYEGLTDRGEHAKRIEKMKLWLEIVKTLRTDLIVIPSNFMSEGTTGDVDTIVRDMLEVAELGSRQQPVVRIAFEALAWGTHIDTWEKAWKVVARVNRPNFGTCLDTFNICARVWGDPTVASGHTPNADADLADSVAALVASVDRDKIFLVQFCDAERMQTPLVPGHAWFNEHQPERMSWSRNARLFPYETGAYLPIAAVARALFDQLKYDGWVSLEVFSRTLTDDDPNTPHTHARRGFESWTRLAQEFDLI